MKNIKLSFFFGLLMMAFTSEAQVVQQSTDSDDFNQFFGSTLNVVLLGVEKYDERIKEAVEKHWTLTPYEFIDMQTLEKKVSDKSRSFLVPMTGDWHWLAIVNGGQRSIKRYTDAYVLAYAPLGKFTEEKNIIGAAYRMDYIIKGINDAIIMVRDHQMKGTIFNLNERLREEINKKLPPLLSGRTLLLNKDTRIVNANPKIDKPEIDVKEIEKSDITFKYKLVSDKEFKAALAENSDEYLCLMPVNDGNQNTLIYDPVTRETVYYGWAKYSLEVKKDTYNDIQKTGTK